MPRILKLQANKQALSDAALGEGKAGKLKKLSVGELKTVRVRPVLVTLY